MSESYIFISYRRDDSAQEAERLKEQLEELQGGVFRDVSDIEVAENFPERITNALKEARFVIVVIGKRWLDICDESGTRRLDNPDDFVRREISYALKRAEWDCFVDIIPVLVQGAIMPSTADLPDDLSELSEINAHRISSNKFERDVLMLSDRADRLKEENGDRANKSLDEIDGYLDAKGVKLGDVASLKPTVAANPDLHNLPDLAEWECSIGNKIKLHFETFESLHFEGKLIKPHNVDIEGTWKLGLGQSQSLIMSLSGRTFDGEQVELHIPIQEKVGARSYGGWDDSGQYYRLEYLRRNRNSKETI